MKWQVYTCHFGVNKCKTYMKKLISLKVILLSLILINCTSDSETNDVIEETELNIEVKQSEFDRLSMLTFWADSIIIPSIDSFYIELNSLNEHVSSFSVNPNPSTLTQLRDQWLTTYKKWQYVEMFDLGVAEEVYFKNRMNIFPANVVRIENNISNLGFNLDDSVNFTSQGFTALDYLLFVIAISLLIIPFGNSETGSNIIFGIIVVYSLGLAIPIWAVTVRRLHDIGLSGWWSLLSCIPYVGSVVLLIMCCMDSKPGSNKYGNNPKGL